MTATRYTAKGRRDAEARRAQQLTARRQAIASGTFEDFLVDFVGIADPSRVSADMLADYRVEYDGAVAEFAA